MRTSRILAALAAIVLTVTSALGVTAAHADDGELTVDPGPGRITFDNGYDEEVTLDWTDGESLEGSETIPAGESITITANTKHFMYSATIEDGLVGQAEWPGIDLEGVPSLPSTGV